MPSNFEKDMLPRAFKNITVLVVDDNRDLLRVISRGLEVGGYQVITAETGDDAIELIGTCRTPDIVLTDGVMPGTAQGWDLARYVKRVHPDTPVVLMSGYVGEAETRVSQTPEIDCFLPKPITLSELSAVLVKLLEDRNLRAVSLVG